MTNSADPDQLASSDEEKTKDSQATQVFTSYE